MVIIDTVYQRVLSIGNKEQRGYITPQEFNLFANQAQMEIFEQYFYDLNQFDRVPGNETLYGDMRDNLDEKISIFQTNATQQPGNLPADMYRLGTILDPTGRDVDKVSRKEASYIENNSLVDPTHLSRYVWYYDGENSFEVVGTTTTANFTIEYVRAPNPVSWGYVVVNHKAMYDPTSSNHFELHASEQSELVNKILSYAGVAMKDPQVSGSGMAMEAQKIQQEKR